MSTSLFHLCLNITSAVLSVGLFQNGNTWQQQASGWALIGFVKKNRNFLKKACLKSQKLSEISSIKFDGASPISESLFKIEMQWHCWRDPRDASRNEWYKYSTNLRVAANWAKFVHPQQLHKRYNWMVAKNIKKTVATKFAHPMARRSLHSKSRRLIDRMWNKMLWRSWQNFCKAAPNPPMLE